MESFTIKYELDDLCDENRNNSTKPNDDDICNSSSTLKQKSSCICFKLARLFGDILSTSKNDDTKNESDKPHISASTTISNPQNELKRIFQEIKIIQKDQKVLQEKFNIFSKYCLPKQDENMQTKSDSFEQKLSKDMCQEDKRRPNPFSSTSNQNVQLNSFLTGAKKRKFLSAKSKALFLNQKLKSTAKKFKNNTEKENKPCSKIDSSHSSIVSSSFRSSSSSSSEKSYSSTNTIMSNNHNFFNKKDFADDTNSLITEKKSANESTDDKQDIIFEYSQASIDGSEQEYEIERSHSLDENKLKNFESMDNDLEEFCNSKEKSIYLFIYHKVPL